MNFNPRFFSQQILLRILQNQSTWDRSLLPQEATAQEKAFIQAACLGVLRHYFQLQVFLKRFLEKPLRKKDQDIEILLLLGTHELICMHTPPHAVLNEIQKTISAKKPWAKGLINAVLRKISSEHPEPSCLDPAKLFPDWIQDLIRKHYLAFERSIQNAHLSSPPMHLRVNIQKNSREDYLQKFPLLDCHIPEFFSAALTLNKPCSVYEIPGFMEGLISVQDLAPQKTPELLELQPHLRVLDACAAPGGKSAHLLETQNQIHLTCLDRSPERALKIQDTFTRLGLWVSAPQVFTQDALEISPLLQFDRILLDAPCSGLGVIRRHPEIALHQNSENLKILSQQQLKLLHALWPCLVPGGILLYATCSMAPEENDQVIEQFLSTHPQTKVLPLNLSHAGYQGLQTPYGFQFLATEHGPDGFYYSKIRKNK